MLLLLLCAFGVLELIIPGPFTPKPSFEDGEEEDDADDEVEIVRPEGEGRMTGAWLEDDEEDEDEDDDVADADTDADPLALAARFADADGSEMEPRLPATPPPILRLLCEGEE